MQIIETLHPSYTSFTDVHAECNISTYKTIEDIVREIPRSFANPKLYIAHNHPSITLTYQFRGLDVEVNCCDSKNRQYNIYRILKYIKGIKYCLHVSSASVRSMQVEVINQINSPEAANHISN